MTTVNPTRQAVKYLRGTINVNTLNARTRALLTALFSEETLSPETEILKEEIMEGGIDDNMWADRQDEFRREQMLFEELGEEKIQPAAPQRDRGPGTNIRDPREAIRDYDSIALRNNLYEDTEIRMIRNILGVSAEEMPDILARLNMRRISQAFFYGASRPPGGFKIHK